MSGDTLFEYFKLEEAQVQRRSEYAPRRRTERVRTILDNPNVSCNVAHADGDGNPIPCPEAPRARRSDPQTSKDAAKSITPGRTERLVLALLYLHDCTADELCALAPELHPPTIKTCLARLRKAELIEDTGVTRPSARGRQSIVWTRKDLP